MKRKSCLLVIIGILFALGVLVPESSAESPWRGEASYGEKVRGKFLYGMANFYGGWISIFYEPEIAAKENKNIAAGVGRGFYKAAVNTGGGLLHFFTAPLTFIDIPLPDNGVDM